MADVAEFSGVDDGVPMDRIPTEELKRRDRTPLASTRNRVPMDRIPTEELKQTHSVPASTASLGPNGQNSDRGIETSIIHSRSRRRPLVPMDRIPTEELKLACFVLCFVCFLVPMDRIPTEELKRE